ncbi:hypothetical protein D3C74_209280 [compost metagenome]
MNEETLREMIIQTISDKSNVAITDHNINFLSNTYGISVVELFYIIDSLEIQLETPLFGLFEESDHNILTVSNLSQHIIQIMNYKQPIM